MFRRHETHDWVYLFALQIGLIVVKMADPQSDVINLPWWLVLSPILMTAAVAAFWLLLKRATRKER